MSGPYLRALPAGFDTPLFWNQTELNELVGSSALATVAERLRTLEQARRRTIFSRHTADNIYVYV